jgi:hypothetical protein
VQVEDRREAGSRPLDVEVVPPAGERERELAARRELGPLARAVVRADDDAELQADADLVDRPPRDVDALAQRSDA